MKYMQVLKNERSGKALAVEVIDESSAGLDSNVCKAFSVQLDLPYICTTFCLRFYRTKQNNIESIDSFWDVKILAVEIV